MRNALAIMRRELMAYFVSPIAYAVTTVFLAISGFVFYLYLSGFFRLFVQSVRNPRMLEQLNINEMIIRPMFGTMSVVAILFILPLLTMRIFSEEKKSGTIELLLTAPVTDWQVILGKFLASLSLYTLMLGLTLVYPLILTLYGNPDWGPISAGYLGLFLMGAGGLTIGVFASSLTENQIIAAVICFGVLLILWLMDGAGRMVGGQMGAVLSYLSVIEHFDDFGKGVIDSSDAVFYLSFIAFGLFLTIRSLESTRWRQ